jgi:hypothetical protein
MKFRILITIAIFFITHSYAQINGCTDPLANNYNGSATINDGSCTYNSASISPVSSVNLGSAVIETSGLIRWGNYVWTHNDNTDINIYGLDTTTGSIMQAYPLAGVSNYDWEEISQDSAYIYVGDFGNNGNGNRTNLHILRVDKNSLILGNPLIDTIWFSYSDQTDFSGSGSNNTDFDCEAFIVSADSIYLFTKQWVSNKTKIYSLPKSPGTYSAVSTASCDVQGLITGATYLESKRMVVLCGYSSLLQPFLYLFYDFNAHKFTSGNKRKISILLPFHQIEGIASTNGKKLFLSNESYINAPFINITQKLHIFDIITFTGNYLDNPTIGMDQISNNKNISINPNPTKGFITIAYLPENFTGEITIMDLSGRKLLQKNISTKNNIISTECFAEGVYQLVITDHYHYFISKKLIKL